MSETPSSESRHDVSLSAAVISVAKIRLTKICRSKICRSKIRRITISLALLIASCLLLLSPRARADGKSGAAASQQTSTQATTAPDKDKTTSAPATTTAAPSANTPGNTVNVYAIVRDKKGDLVSDVKQSDLTLTEDGHPETIQSFTKVSTEPLTVGLLVDTSASQWRALDQERKASRAFLDQTIREGSNKAFIIHFDREVELLQDVTSSQEKLQKALDSLQAAQNDRSDDNNSQDQDSGQRTGGYGRHSHGGAQLYDAVYLACTEILKKIPGRKVLIVFSNGVDRSSKESLDSALEEAQRSNAMLYTLRLKGEEEEERSNRGGFGGMGGPGMGGPMGGGGMGRHGGGRGSPQEQRVDGKKILERISNQTGGRFIDVTKKESLDDVYGQIEQELKSQYDLAYSPARSDASSVAYHKIHITASKDSTVQARDGYYSDTNQ
jgi:VWFA-related protein